MSSLRKERKPLVCPKTGKPLKQKKERYWLTLLFPIGGLFALLWFLLRVIPKPSRATYPCQRVAFPFASGFIIWLVGAIGSVAAIRRAKRYFAQSRYILCVMLVAFSIGVVWLAQSFTTEEVLYAEEPTANAPIGVAKGIHPGRVVWVHDPEATDWNGPGDGHWWQRNHTNQAVVDQMMSRAIQTLSGEDSDIAAWDTLIKHFNKTRDKGEIGYQKGEKIVVKVNFVGCIRIWNSRPVKSIEDYNYTIRVQRP